ncbi:pyrimidine dimer DNA glycosylase/endonuclease V [Marinitoga litoralis]|uniref:pyrimidine dimer DNA glycosylase/endonuclease V n=1 Tax=Marinitoga litoralis TaxID=570855 RepID=UPI00195FF800|nr:pyrimidine dimer DNA glycosylase/endonuclease V [Marinitoga litoralis]MBM7558466.1 hypothetical protein [Marinitoga litoralis]
MRLWSIHPIYLDVKGLLACWREGLLAKKVLEGKTKGYKNHPQLIRFKNYDYPLKAINAFLYQIYLEAKKRGYNFDGSKIEHIFLEEKIKVTSGQVKYEFEHLLNKLKFRDIELYNKLKDLESIEINEIFEQIPGDIESWEKF